MRILLIMALAIGLTGCASNANDVAKSDQAGATAAEVKKTNRRCYREQSTGSRLGKRICKDAAEVSGN